MFKRKQMRKQQQLSLRESYGVEISHKYIFCLSFYLFIYLDEFQPL